MGEVMNMYRAQRGKGKRPSRLMARTRVAYLLLQVSVSVINHRAQRGKGKRPSRTAVSARKGAA